MTPLHAVVFCSAVLAAACSSSLPPPQPASDPPASASSEAAPLAPPESEPATASAAAAEPETTGPGVSLCDVVCEQAFVEPGSASDGAEDIAHVTEDANRVLDGMKADLLTCYENRIRAKPQAHAFMTLSVLIGTDGKVKDVETKGGALLGDQAIRCIVDRIRKGSFQPPRGRGTVRIEVPFILRKVAEGA